MKPSRVKKTTGRKAGLTRVSLIGAGRMGLALALALQRTKKYTIESIVVHRPRQAATLAAQFPPRTQILTSAKLRQIPDSELFIIATPDATIRDTAGRLHDVYLHREKHQRTALHLSGALSSDELAELRAVGFAVGSLHPLVSVSDSQQGAQLLCGAHYGVEGDERALQKARALVRSLKGKAFSLKTQDKILYHAAAVLSAGHITTLFAVSVELLRLCGLSESTARHLLLPLAQSTLTNLASRPASHTLTGPFPRGDAEIITRHLAALQQLSDALPLEIYRTLGLRSLQLAMTRGLDHQAAQRITELLAER